MCFLHSYANPDHERAVAALVREGTGGHGPRAGFVTASCEVLPEFREYERFNTTALNAYIGPLIDGYLARLQASVAARGYRSPVFIMTSNGGVATAERARRLPVATVLSGPAGGVAAAANLGQRLDLPNLISCDMGGTSTDVCLIEELVVPLTNEQFVGPYANRTPQTEINAVGAGGGSIAWIAACGRFLGDFLAGDGGPATERWPDLRAGDVLKIVLMDVKTYYLEAALARPGRASSRDLEDWFWGDTNAGQMFLALQRKCAANDDPFIATLGRQFIVPRAQAHRIR